MGSVDVPQLADMLMCLLISKAGGIPNGEPGERPEYAKGYYAAFVLDPLGNNIEVVYFSPWWLRVINAAPGVAMVVFGAVAGHFAMGYAKGAGWA
jgi:hypothetical protein